MTPSQTAHPTEGEKAETLEALERDARQLWNTRQEACALYGADISMPTLAVPVDLLCKLLSQPVRPQGEEGLAQEPKYRFDGGRVINRASGEAIPLDEPVFIFRARDLHAQGVLEEYAMRVFDPAHSQAIVKRIGDFKRFRQSHPERMKEPDTDLSNQGEPSS